MLGMVIFCKAEILDVAFWQLGNRSASLNGAREVDVLVAAVRVAVTTSTTVTVTSKLTF